MDSAAPRWEDGPACRPMPGGTWLCSRIAGGPDPASGEGSKASAPAERRGKGKRGRRGAARIEAIEAAGCRRHRRARDRNGLEPPGGGADRTYGLRDGGAAGMGDLRPPGSSRSEFRRHQATGEGHGRDDSGVRPPPGAPAPPQVPIPAQRRRRPDARARSVDGAHGQWHRPGRARERGPRRPGRRRRGHPLEHSSAALQTNVECRRRGRDDRRRDRQAGRLPPDRRESEPSRR